jgi:hypothetical protein
MRAFLGGRLSTIRKRFFDDFSRITSTGLGIAKDGSTWSVIRGTINASANAAVAASTTGYPISAIDMQVSDVSVKLSGTNQGSTVALWVQSSADWYGVEVDMTTSVVPGNAYLVPVEYTYLTSYNYSYYTGYNFNYYNTYNYLYNYYTTSSYYNTYNYNYNFTYTRYTSGTRYYTYFSGGPINASYTYYSVVGYTTLNDAGQNYAGPFYVDDLHFNVPATGSSGPYSGSGNTGPIAGSGFTNAVGNYYYTAYNASSTSYDQYVRVIKSVGSVVSTVTSWLVSSSATVRSFIVRTSGNQITVRPYSDVNFISQIGSDLVYTATGAAVTTQFGISVSPSTVNQSATIGTSVTIDRN